jgi:hypothetical protein
MTGISLKCINNTVPAIKILRIEFKTLDSELFIILASVAVNSIQINKIP